MSASTQFEGTPRRGTGAVHPGTTCIPERSLDESRRLASELFPDVRGGYVQTDAWGKILLADNAASEMLNVPLKLLRGKKLPNCVVGKDGRRDFQRSLIHLRRGGIVVELAIVLRPRKGAPLLPVVISAAARVDGTPRAFIAHWLLRASATSKPLVDDST